MDFIDSPQFQQGKSRLEQPILPLVRLLQLLYLTGPFAKIAEILPELNEPVDTGAVLYDDPHSLLAPYLPILQDLEHLKNGRSLTCSIADEQGETADLLESLELWTAQGILAAELEEINSLLCGPCRCTLCCTGPDKEMVQQFFEIPLAETETRLFELPTIDTAESRRHSAMDEPPFTVEGRPFFEAGPVLIHWRNGWSLILPTDSSCPNLEEKSCCCRVYPERPTVCRRPQIFSYVLEAGKSAARRGETAVASFTARKKILAVWDCPYVQALKDEIAAYAEICGMEPVFKTNKA
jgi:hypothetical protein